MSLQTKIFFSLAFAVAVALAMKLDVVTQKHALRLMASAVWGS